MKLTIGCAYCRAPNSITIPIAASIAREVDLGKYTCVRCGSVVQLEIKSKRVRKGKEMLLLEAAALEFCKRNVDAQRAVNATIGEALLKQDGCTCAPRIGPRLLDRDAQDAGHPLSTGWSRDDKRGGMMPTIPQHFHGCPCRNTAAEDSIRLATPQPKAIA